MIITGAGGLTPIDILAKSARKITENNFKIILLSTPHVSHENISVVVVVTVTLPVHDPVL